MRNSRRYPSRTVRRYGRDRKHPSSIAASGIFQCLAEVTIVNQKGLHARASAEFVKLAQRFDAEVAVTKGGQTVGGSSIMSLLMLQAGPGTTILIETDGPEAEEALEALTELVEDGVTGLSFAPGSPDDLSRKVQFLWERPELCRAMGVAARASVRSKFDADTNYSLLLGAYRAAMVFQVGGTGLCRPGLRGLSVP